MGKRGYKPFPLSDRILNNHIPVTESGCWLWTSKVCRNGYGRLKINGKYFGAHRVSYEAFVGEIPDGLVVMHKCDVRSCVNPNHLMIGTYKDNLEDARKKGRWDGQKKMLP